MRTYHKINRKMFSKSITRIIVFIVMFFLSIALITAIGSLAPRIYKGIDELPPTIPIQIYEYFTFMASGIERISYIFPPFFIFLCFLVVFITMARLIETERPMIACLATLGYTRNQIAIKYIFFVFILSMIGSILGLIIGHFFIHEILMSVVTKELRGLPKVAPVFPLFGLISALVCVVLCFFLTMFIFIQKFNQVPANLLKSKPPAAGKKIFLESIPFIWRKMSFKYKSTYRNIFRYKIRFILTILTVLISCVLVFIGISLYFSLKQTNPEIMDIILPISVIISIAAVSLNAIVVFNIININIDERNIEIATLKVLGYKNKEIAGFIFREIFILSISGMVLGLPVGYGFMAFMFDFLRFGGLEFVKWYVFFIVFGLVFLSLLIAIILLVRKLNKTSMDSLFAGYAS